MSPSAGGYGGRSPRSGASLDRPGELAGEAFCFLTTTGRVSGRPHTIEIWFALDEGSFYLLAEGRERTDWVRNMRAEPRVTVKVRDVTFPAVARFVDDPTESDRARRLLATKYQDWEEGAELSNWARTALLVALDPTG